MVVLDRRHFLGLALSAGLGINFSSAAQAGFLKEDRRLYLKNMHTDEKVDLIYWANGKYLPESIASISHLLRDHRRNEILPIDISLIDSLYKIHSFVSAPYGIEVYSGYRSPKTNQVLRRINKSVARKSYHMVGKAVDIRIPGVKLSTVKKAAISLKLGGVGYYKKSGFIHIDTGRVRQWGS